MTDSREERVAPLVARMVELYRADRLRVATICDEHLDRTGNLLGYLRDAALELSPDEQEEDRP